MNAAAVARPGDGLVRLLIDESIPCSLAELIADGARHGEPLPEETAEALRALPVGDTLSLGQGWVERRPALAGGAP